MTPRISVNPNEVIYEEWDCPQMQAIHPYQAQQSDELSLDISDVVNVLKKTPDGILLPILLFFFNLYFVLRSYLCLPAPSLSVSQCMIVSGCICTNFYSFCSCLPTSCSFFRLLVYQ